MDSWANFDHEVLEFAHKERCAKESQQLNGFVEDEWSLSNGKQEERSRMEDCDLHGH
jgi:hypothetical protein